MVDGPLMLVFAVSIVGKPFYVVEISNWDWKYKKQIRAQKKFYTRIREVKAPFYLISGYREAVKRPERNRLKVLARSFNRSQIRSELATINAVAAPNGNGGISEECCVSSLFADGPETIRGEMVNIGRRGGDMHRVGAGVGTFDIKELVKKHGGISEPVIVQSGRGSFGRPVQNASVSLPRPVGGDNQQPDKSKGRP
jgi:hypothetical protein